MSSEDPRDKWLQKGMRPKTIEEMTFVEGLLAREGVKPGDKIDIYWKVVVNLRQHHKEPKVWVKNRPFLQLDNGKIYFDEPGIGRIYFFTEDVIDIRKSKRRKSIKRRSD